MHSLVVEDDFVCRKALTAYLAPYGPCDVATDGIEALAAVDIALQEGKPYDLICLDIMMPNLDGQQTLAAIRAREQRHGIHLGSHAKVIMTTALDDKDNVFSAFRGNADAYLTKPIGLPELIANLEKLGLIG